MIATHGNSATCGSCMFFDDRHGNTGAVANEAGNRHIRIDRAFPERKQAPDHEFTQQ